MLKEQAKKIDKINKDIYFEVIKGIFNRSVLHFMDINNQECECEICKLVMSTLQELKLIEE